MLLRIDQVLKPAKLKMIQEALGDSALFEDGQRTAGRSARQVKRNLQVRPGARLDVLGKEVERALRDNEVFMAAVRPKKFIAVRFNRHEAGMVYGPHLDEPVIGGVRVDISFSVFLSDPADYDGGALIIEGPDGALEIKLDAGQAVIYPATTLHHVAQVTRGTRLAAFGWVRSLIRRSDQREILFDLDLGCRQVFESEGKTPLHDRLAKARNNLVHLWVED